MSITQHQEDTKYLKWQDGMYVLLEDMLCDYEKALVEDSLRRSVYYTKPFYFAITGVDNCLGVLDGECGLWSYAERLPLEIKLNRAQALYIATGNTDI
jgi:hypothetical protein